LFVSTIITVNKDFHRRTANAATSMVMTTVLRRGEFLDITHHQHGGAFDVG